MVGRRISVIDIGSNSVRLLVADVNDKGIHELYKDLNTTRLYKNISKDYILDSESMDRTVKAIAEFVEIADRRSSDEIYMFATAAVRVAKNRNDFIRQVREKTRIILEVIPEDKEAELAFAGVDSNGMCAVIDIGGASTEIAIGEHGKILSASSAKIGAVKCKELIEDDSDSQEIVSLVENILLKENSKPIEYAKNKDNIKWYGVGGTITTAAAMLNELEEYDADIINNSKISYSDLDMIIKSLQDMSIEQRKYVAGLQPKRADIIVYGLLILLSIMKNCNIEYVHSSDNDNLTGYINLLIREE